MSNSLHHMHSGGAKVVVLFAGMLAVVAIVSIAHFSSGKRDSAKPDANLTWQPPAESMPRLAPTHTAGLSAVDEGQVTESSDSETLNATERPALDSRTSALPGLEGVYVSADDGAVNTLASALAFEAENDMWSGKMEASLLDQISRLHDRGVVSVNVECRSKTCGVLLLFSRNSDEFLRRVNFPRIADELGFHLRAGLPKIAEDGTPFTVFYMQMAPRVE